MARIERALISVSDKNGLPKFAAALHGMGVQLLSTGGTSRILREAGLPVTDVSDVTGFPEIMDGRVKTLHPAIHGGLLARRDREEDMRTIRELGIQPIDLVVVNLYPFAERTAAGLDLPAALEEIDIGGPSMLRAAAKNFAHVAVVVDPADYPAVLDEMVREGGTLTTATRFDLARKVFRHTAAYDATVSQYLDNTSCEGITFRTPCSGEETPRILNLVLRQSQVLRYGENPHQRGALYVDASHSPTGWAAAEQLHGKELSYNNYLDMDGAWALVNDFPECACAIIKHSNPCGAALGADPAKAYRLALETDPESSYGSIIAFNRPVTEACAKEMSGLFVEVVVAPAFEEAALELFFRKKNLRVVRRGPIDPVASRFTVRGIEGAFLVQEADRGHLDPEGMRVVSQRQPTPAEIRDLGFAWTCAKHVKSNAIVIVRDGRLLGVGAGQMSRVDSARIAVSKCRTSPEGAVVGSDAFLPFRDTLDVVAEAGIAALAEPGGSVRDQEVIEAADQRNVALLFTGVRHFRH